MNSFAETKAHRGLSNPSAKIGPVAFCFIKTSALEIVICYCLLKSIFSGRSSRKYHKQTADFKPAIHCLKV
ncbi:hypothetical protein ACHAXS_010608 [Conticribra weissflogii]